MRPGLFLVLGLLLAPLLVPGAAFAQNVQPLDRLLPQIRRAHPGQFVDADGPNPGMDGSQHYHLKWMTPDGRILWLDADARTGRVLGLSPGRDNFDRRQGLPAPPRVLDGPRNNFRYQGGSYGGNYGNSYGGNYYGRGEAGRPFGGGGGGPMGGNRGFGRERGRGNGR
jgi:hypothetical protein